MRRVGKLQARDLWDRSRAYKRTFDTAGGRIVLRDLAAFCFLDKTTHVVGDPYQSAVAEGRRQVLLRITAYCRLTPAEIDSFTVEVEE
jgi:hypothetical protein